MDRRKFLTLTAAAVGGAFAGTAFELSKKKETVESIESVPSVTEMQTSEERVLEGKETKETQKKFAVGAFLDEEIDRLAQALVESAQKELLLFEFARICQEEKDEIYAKRFSNSEEQMVKYFKPFLDLKEDIRDALDKADPLRLIPRAVLCGVIGMESGGRKAVNRETGAAGIFQLNLITAKELGLKVDKTVDERMNLKKSASATARYLLDLHEKFGRQWGLALMAYAGGPAKLSGRIRKHFNLDSQTAFTPDLFSKKNINAVTLYREFGAWPSVQYPFGAQAMAQWAEELVEKERRSRQEEEGRSALARL